ncbi:restriction endonuclease subunit S [Carboxylicivirga marina]|uniref:Restriction endonuclease subunit S n=1 Tax=Carboxylicivirga marina TaxID=2800988 RepID=A0ABS1HIU6_9BACT|nr:restriction endonuclease subunit S [Carboxylicivirga marina]MBK3517600.1 restriction endonuclease subunit S [Carboxylicivirga marina]
MSKWENVEIGSSGLKIADGNYSAKYPRSEEFIVEGVPFIRANNFKNKTIQDEDMYFISPEKHAELKKGHVLPNDVLITTRGNIGEVAIVPKRHNDSNINAQIVLLRSYGNFHPLYLLHVLGSNLVKEQLPKLTTGTALKQLPVKNLKKIKIPLPPLPTQQKIAAILDEADKLRQLNKQLIAKYEALSQSLFLEMFGDYIHDKNSKKKIEDIASFIDYRGKTPERVDNGVPLISAKCVRPGYFDKTRLDFISKETYSKVMTRGYPKVGDVLFTTEGATLGYTCRIPNGFKDFAVGQRLITLQVNENYNAITLDYMLNSDTLQFEIFKQATGSAAKGIRSAKFAKILIPVPPLLLQNLFAQRIQVIEQQKAQAQQALAKSEDLFNSLLQRTFKTIDT